VNILAYFLVFVGSLLVDVIPLVGPPAWTVMVFFQTRYGLNIWLVLILGVTGSAIGRYLYSSYVPYFSKRFIKTEKNDDLQFIGRRLAHGGWRIQLFVLLYTLMPLPSTPLFTAAGVARIRTLTIIPAFFVGKFISDALMVITGKFVVNNVKNISQSFLSWKTLAGTILGILLICMFLFIDWKKLLQEKKFRLGFNIWKKV
jgi:membrane protein YqaA with SNARE-associated domain